ncbi:AsmA-like C-terminal region-containing protein [Winogradskyella forsetii]|uniref:AsmA-like C-terminal region-containing protein n=1 Tax=Winogradskyella forsetii TaxID=2686077 RepID=UPI0015BE39BB|nr:AsmA-like C-terminal region-containing protein [Winogradskyella forsetii]
METPKPKQKKTTSKKWRKRILVMVLIIVLVPTTLFTIGWLNRDTIIDVLQDWYLENNSGTLTIGEVNTSFISGFPNVGFTLKDIKHTYTDTISDKFSNIEIEEAKVVIGAGNLLRGHIKFENITVKNAVIASEVISEKSLAYHEQLKYDKENEQRKGIQMPQWLHDDGVIFLLENVKYITKDSILNKDFDLDIHKIKGTYKRDGVKLKGNLNMNLTVNKLGFNTKKGTYFNGAHVSGAPEFTINLEKDIISVPEFLFKVDEQNFNLIANFDLVDGNQYDFQLQNSKTDFNAVKGLLPDNIVTKIAKYDIEKPIETNLHLFGNFAYGSNPTIEVDFSTESNAAIIKEKLQLKNLTLNGHLTNEIYTSDSLKIAKKSAKDLKITFDDFKANLDDIKVDLDNSYFQSTPEALNFIEANINLNGSNEALAKLIETNNFDFLGGTFQFNAVISGDIPTTRQFVDKATGTFKLKDTRVVLKKNGLQLPIQTIDLALNRENSTLNKLIVNFPNGEDLVLKGQLKNISGLLSKNPETSTTSHISVDSKQLNINDLISLSKKFMPKSKKNLDDRKNLHETLETVYLQFHPSFEINVDDLTYKNVTIKNLKSQIDLVDSKTIQLRNFDFNYLDARTNLKGSVVVPEAESNLRDAIYINAEATSRGDITIFQNLFNIQLFRFDAGIYQFSGRVKGNVRNFGEILNSAKGDFNLLNTKLYYEPAKMNIDIDSLALFVDKSNMQLKKFNLEIGELYPMRLNGEIKNFPSFLMENVKDSGSIFLKISAPFINGDTLLTTISSLKDEKKLKYPTNKRDLYQVFRDVNKFNPKIELEIDTLKYKDLITENVEALVYFENDSILKLNNLHLNYKETTANISGKINAHTNQLDSLRKNPFDLDFLVDVKGKSEDLNAYFNTRNFIFKSGDFEFKGRYKAQSENLNILKSTGFGDLKISHALVDYKAAALQIPVDSLHLEINNDVARLKRLDIDLPGKSSVYFSGSINQFSNFIDNAQGDNLRSSYFSIYSPYLDSSDIKEFLSNSASKTKKTKDKEPNLQKFREALVGINSSFYPKVNVTIDTLRHEDLNLTDFGLDLLFDSSGDFKIKDTHLNFYGGSLTMDIDFGMTNETNIPVNIVMNANAIDLHELVTRFDYFNDEALRNTDKIEGNLKMSIDATGALKNDGNLNMNSLNGTMHFELSDFELYNYKPVMENSFLMKDERFEKLSFRPIIQTFEIVNGELIIPRTEIQSSAIHLFAEGRFKFDEYVNIWLSLPWKNLKSNDGLTLPKKTTYEDAGAKFYVQLLQDKTEEKDKDKKLDVKVKLSNRKLRKMKQKRE